MRRNQRSGQKNSNSKSILYLTGFILGIALISFVVTFIIYSNKLNRQASELRTEKIAQLVPNEVETEEANAKMGRTVEESENLIQNNTTILQQEENTTVNNATVTEKPEEATRKANANTVNTTKQQEEKIKVADPEFIKPVEGDIIKKFASENLLYSETLKEWVTHYGVDIAATRTSMVKAAAEGTVTAIKNDPRYGTTVMIEHVNGFETRYSNLLTSEFVVVGEKVEQGQSIGTVGNTAMFEVAEESHLHFELLKDSEALDPELYFK